MARGRAAKSGKGKGASRRNSVRWHGAWLRALARPPEILRADAISVGDVWGERVHSTPSHEWLHVLQGHATIRIRGRSIRVGPKDTLVIPQGTPHLDIRDQGPDYRVLYVFFRWPSGHALLERFDPARLVKAHDAARQHLHALAGELEREYLSDDPGAPERIQVLLCEAMLAMARAADRVVRERPASNARAGAAVARRSKAMAAVLAYLEEHHARDIGLEELARHFGLSPFSLSRAFTQAFGRPLVETLTGIRVEKARAWLEQGLSVKEAAVRVGYSNGNYFAKVFRRVTGKSPSEFLAASARNTKPRAKA